MHINNSEFNLNSSSFSAPNIGMSGNKHSSTKVLLTKYFVPDTMYFHQYVYRFYYHLALSPFQKADFSQTNPILASNSTNSTPILPQITRVFTPF